MNAYKVELDRIRASVEKLADDWRDDWANGPDATPFDRAVGATLRSCALELRSILDEAAS